MGLDTVPSIPRALRGRDATEECRWIMSLELDGGKQVLAMTGEITKLVSRWASSGLLLAPAQLPASAKAVCGGRGTVKDMCYEVRRAEVCVD